MAEVVNLRTARKQLARVKVRAQADENAAKHGRSKAQVQAEEQAAERARRHLDGHERE